MEWGRIYMLFGLTFSTILDNTVLAKSSSACQDSLKQWEEHEWICGFSVTKMSESDLLHNFNSNISLNGTSTTWMSNFINVSDSDGLLEDSSDISIQDQKNQITKQIIINYDDFRCCLKNIVINIRSPQQRQKCLANFVDCVTKVQTSKCTIHWRFYMNLILHDEKFMLVVIFILLVAFMAVLFSTYKCNNNTDSPTIARENLRR